MEKKDEGKEKDVKKESIPSWNDFDFMHPEQKLPKQVLPAFKPGDTERGLVFLQLLKPLEGKSLTIYFEGQAMTLVQIYSQHGYADIKGEDVYVKEEKLVWQNDPSGKDDLSDTFALLSTSDTPLVSKHLPAGKNKFHFEFTLPSECLGSTPNLLPSSWSYYAYIFYRVKAKIDSGKTFTKDPVTYKGLWIDQKMDIAADADDMSPFSLEENLDTGIAFWKGGRVSCTAKLPRRAFLRG